MFWSLPVCRRRAAALALLACVGPAISYAAETLPAPARSCSLSMALPAPPRTALRVTDFGADGRGERDDTAAIERALAALKPGQWLVFPPGRYRHARRLQIDTPGVTLYGVGATLHATDPADQALIIQADRVRVLGFTLTALTDKRRAAPWESRIAVWRERGERARLGRVRGVEIRGNRIVPAADDDDGPARLANSSASAAIFVSGAEDFLVAGNTVRRSLSDGIHITGGSRNGRVIGNTVRETGDDMIAVVSYLGDGMWDRAQTSVLADSLETRRDDKLVRNVLIADNDVEGQYWGRGISVVGGESITIRRNRIANTSHAAGIYISREQVYVTFGVRDVRIEGNAISQVQTMRAPYNPLPLPQRLQRTGHGAIEINALVFDDEAAVPALADALTVARIALLDNRIDGAGGSGIRIGVGWGQARERSGRGPQGEALRRVSRGGPIHDIVLAGNRLSHLRGAALELLMPAETLRLSCERNTEEGSPLRAAACDADADVAPTAGATIGCDG